MSDNFKLAEVVEAMLTPNQELAIWLIRELGDSDRDRLAQACASTQLVIQQVSREERKQGYRYDSSDRGGGGLRRDVRSERRDGPDLVGGEFPVPPQTVATRDHGRSDPPR